MHTPINFEYDLWTTKENEVTHYWVRVKSTGEVTEVDRDVMRCLRSEEKRIRRDIEDAAVHGSVLSLDVPRNEERESWYEDRSQRTETIEMMIDEKEFRALLTPFQLAVYENCMLNRIGIRAYARSRSLHHKTVEEAVSAIRKKYKKFFQ